MAYDTERTYLLALLFSGGEGRTLDTRNPATIGEMLSWFGSRGVHTDTVASRS